MKAVHFIIYVSEQERSTQFYKKVFNLEPSLNVPGMTEFILGNGCILGIMPEQGIKNLLGDNIESPSLANGIPRSELYLIVDKPEEYHARALSLGARELSAFESRSWGHSAAYSADLDGHVLVFASDHS